MLGDSATDEQVSLQWTAQHRSRILLSREEEDEIVEDFRKGGLRQSSMNLVRLLFLLDR